jgi:Tol biopolymer transport system component
VHEGLRTNPGFARVLIAAVMILPAACVRDTGGEGPVALQEADDALVAETVAGRPAQVTGPVPSPSPFVLPPSDFDCRDQIVRVSLTSSGRQANGESWYPTASGDGRFVVFISHATDMVPGDTNGKWDVFVRDRKAGETKRAGVSSSGKEAALGAWSPTISGDGRFVAFVSKSGDIVPGDTNGEDDIFVHDRKTGVTERITLGAGGAEPDGMSWVRSVSAHGRFVVFMSEATNLVSGDTNGKRDVFVHDRVNGTTKRVSVSSSGTEGDGPSNWHDISADGRFVVFESEATNLVPDDGNDASDVFVHDRLTGRTSRASVKPGGGEADGGSGRPAISADGRFVTFRSDASNLVPDDTNGKTDVFVHDRKTGRTERVSVESGGGEGDGPSSGASISADGRFVAFESQARDLVDGGEKGDDLVCVHDRRTGETARVNVSARGAEADGQSYFLWISADGRFVTFSSAAKNLVHGDTNDCADVFVARNPFLPGLESGAAGPAPPKQTRLRRLEAGHLPVRGATRTQTGKLPGSR